MTDYSYDMSWDEERERLRTIESCHDPGTIDIFRRLGVGINWRCLEIGAGGGSIAEWLSDRAEHVVATDLDTRFLADLEAPNIEIRTHNIVTDPLEEEAFDLVHSRMLLEHLPAREDVLKKLVASLRPGGWIVVEDLNFAGWENAVVTAYPDNGSSLILKGIGGVIAIMERHGLDRSWALRMVSGMPSLGLIEFDSEMSATLVYGGSPASAFFRLSIKQLAPALLESNAMTQAEIDEALLWLDDPATSCLSLPIIRCWGRKP